MIPHNKLVPTDADRAAVARVLGSGHIAQGPEVEAFERELAERFRPDGAAVCVSSGTAALMLAMELTPYVADFRISTYTCAAAYHAAAFSHQGPALLSDIDPVTLHPITRHLSEHTYGLLDSRPALIEDFTHCPVPPAGSIGTLSVISFGATKPLAAGAGGAVLGPKEAIAEIRDRRDYDGKRDLRECFNFQLSDLHACLGREKLKRLPQEYEWRRQTAARYISSRTFGWKYQQSHGQYRFLLETDPGHAIPQLAEYGVRAIQPLAPWELLHRKLGLSPTQFPNAEKAAASLVSLPIWPGMSDAEVGQVCSALEKL